MGRNNTFHSSTGFKQLSLFPLKGQRLGLTPKIPEFQVLHGNVSKGKVPNLYHGSPSLIKPGESLNTGGPYSKTEIHATSSPAIASQYAVGRSRDRGDATGQHSFWSVLHKVDPVPGAKVSKDISTHGKNIDAYVSRQFKVNKPIGLIDNVTGGVTPVGKEEVPGLSAPGKRLDTPTKSVAWQEQLLLDPKTRVFETGA